MTMLCILLVCLVGVASSSPLQDLDTDPRPVVDINCGYKSCPQTSPGTLNVHIVPHSHDDVGWLKTVDQYYYGSRNNIQKAGVQYILDSVVKELWENPARRFIYVETFFFWKWWSHQNQSVKNKVHILVNQGRLQFVGGAWSMNDEAAVHYQSTVDQFTWGLSKLNETFGECGIPRVGWQIDPFGHSREFSSLLAGMGYHGLFLGRIDFQDKSQRLKERTMEMIWRGDDDLGKSSDLFTGVLYNTYSPPPGFCFDVLCSDEPIIDDTSSPMFNVDRRINAFLNLVSMQRHYYRTPNVIMTMGGDFTYQDASMWYKNLDKLIEHANLKSAKEDLKIKLFYSTPDCYLNAVKNANPTLPIKQDDFFPYASDPNAFWTGYFTSRPTTKFFEREGNSYLQMAKQLQVLANLEEHNTFILDELKSAMGILQHHDAITGTEKQHVTHDYERILHRAIEDSLIIPGQAFNKYMQGSAVKPPILKYERCRLNESSCYTSEDSERFIVTAYNHLAWQVNEPIRIPVVEGTYVVFTPNGQEITVQSVTIPASVINIPTRVSKATHEIVFIAKLKPVSYKSFYIMKKTHTIDKRETLNNEKDKNNYYKENINDYWKNIKDRLYVKMMEEEKLAQDSMRIHESPEKRIPDEPVFNTHVDNHVYLNADVLRDNEDVVSPDVEQIEKIIREVNLQLNDDSKLEVPHKPDFISYSNLNEDELRMLSDEPIVVEQLHDEVLLENEHVTVRVNSSTGQIIAASLSDGTSFKFNIKYSYYPGCYGNNRIPSNRSSGAYIFRPNATEPVPVRLNFVKGPDGRVVKELRAVSNDGVASTIRIYDGLNFIENDWIIGPINVNDGIGKEYVVRYVTDIVNHGEFYTDSNGRQMLKRKLCQRPQWNVHIAEPIAGNYYPVTNKIYIQDAIGKVAVLVDRPEGGSSLHEGQVELMLHRRLLHDDAFGVDEALNEMALGKGLVVRGRHRIFFSKPKSGEANIQEKKQVLQFHLQPQILVADAKNLPLNDWLKLKNCFSWANQMPDGIHLLTLEPKSKNILLLRLENYLELNDRDNTTIEIDLKSIFRTLNLMSFKETTLAANMLLKYKESWSWNKEKEFAKNFNEGYGRNINEKYVNRNETVFDDGFKIKIKAKQIRTFLVEYTIKD